jgi:hypothetical protein
MDVNSRDPSQNIIPFSITGIEAARFDSSGNLGIGTTTPSVKLDISGDLNTSGFATFNKIKITGSLQVPSGTIQNSFTTINMDSQISTTALNKQKKQSIPLATSSILRTSDILAKMSGVSVGKTQVYGVGPSQSASYGNIVVSVGEGTNSIAYSLANPPTASTWVGIPNSTNVFGVGTAKGWGIAYGNGTWVAVGEGSNSIAYSTMTPPVAASWVGITNTNTINGISNTFATRGNTIIYANGVWLAGGSGTNCMAYSMANPPTADSWIGIPLSTSIFNANVYGITYANGTWVAVGDGTNCIAYSTRTPPTADSWTGIPLGNLNEVGTNNVFSNSGIAYGITYANGVWLVDGSGTNVLCYSIENPPVASSWMPITSTSLFGTSCRSIAYGNGIWVAIGNGSNFFAYSTAQIPYSNSWIAMKGATPSGMLNVPCATITFNATTNTWYFMCSNSSSVNNSNCLFYSTVTPPLPATWIAVPKTVNTFTTQGYAVATATTSAFTTPVNVARHDNKVTFPVNRMIAVGGGGGDSGSAKSGSGNVIGTRSGAAINTIVYSEDDGNTWQAVPGGSTNSMFSSAADISANTSMGVGGSGGANSVAWNGEKWIAAGNGRTHSLAFSDDGGINWFGITGKSIFSVEARAIAWNGSMWVAVGRGSLFSTAYSYDGVTWIGSLDASGNNVFDASSSAVSDISGGGNQVVWNGKLWVATGTLTLVKNSNPARYYTMAYSLDGKTWTCADDATNGSGSASNGFDIYAYGIAWNGRNFIATGRGTTNTLAFSIDGINWVGIGKTIFSNWGRGIAWGGSGTGGGVAGNTGRWVATGSGINTIAYSINGRNWKGCGAKVFKPVRRFMAIGDMPLYLASSSVSGIQAQNRQRGVAFSYSDDGITWDSPVINQNLEFTDTILAIPNAFYVRTGGSNWRDYIPLQIANTTTNIVSWNADLQFYEQTSSPASEVAKQFSYFAGFWLNALRAKKDISYNIPVYNSSGFLGTFIFWSTTIGTGFPVTTYSGSLSTFLSGATQVLIPQADGINSGIAAAGKQASGIWTGQMYLSNIITDTNIQPPSSLMYSGDGGSSWARVPGSSDSSGNAGTNMTIGNNGCYSIATNPSRTRFLATGGDISSNPTQKVSVSLDGFNWNRCISSPNTSNQFSWVRASLWVGGTYNRWLIGGQDISNAINGRIMFSNTNTNNTTIIETSWNATTGTDLSLNNIINCFAANTDYSVILAGVSNAPAYASILQSVDGGTSWAQRTTVDISSVNSIAFSPTANGGNGRWVAVGGTTASPNTINYSTDASGTSWVSPSSATSIFKAGSICNRVIWDTVNSRFIVGGWNGSIDNTRITDGSSIAYSSDGITWYPISILDSDGIRVSGNNTNITPFITRCRDIVALDTAGEYTPVNTGYSVTWNSYANRFIATGNGTSPVVVSNDGGVTWTPSSSQVQQQAIAVVCGTAPASVSNTAISPIAYTIDGENWAQCMGAKEIFSGTGAIVYCVKYGQTSTAISPNGRLWVAGGTAGTSAGTITIAVSQNGIRWTGITASKSLIVNVRCITYAPAEAVGGNAAVTSGSGVGNGIWLAGGDISNSLIFSYDGISWSEVPNSLTILTRCNACAYGNGLFIIGGTPGSAVPNSYLAYSRDGINWRNIPFTNTRISTGGGILSITYGQDEQGRGLWVAGANSTGTPNVSLLYSYNGIDWVSVISSATLATSVNSIAYGINTTTGLGLWVASVNPMPIASPTYTLIQSTNGRTWTSVANTRTNIFDSLGGSTSVSYLNGVWYATGSSTSFTLGKSSVAYSYDGTSWLGMLPYSNMYGLGAGSNSLQTYDISMSGVATVNDIVFPSSLTPIRDTAWTASTGSTYIQHPTIIIGKEITRTLTRNVTALSTDGGRSWGTYNTRTQLSIPNSSITTFGNFIFNGVCNDAHWNGRLWVAVGYDTVTKTSVATSVDGINWTQIAISNIPISGVINSVMWNGTNWIIGGDGTATNNIQSTVSMATSLDGEKWTGINNSYTKCPIVKKLTWNGNYYMSIGTKLDATSYITQSIDGKIWIDASSNISPYTSTASSLIEKVNDIIWGGSRWIVVGRGNSNSTSFSILYSTDISSGSITTDFAYTGKYWTGVIGSSNIFPYGVNSISWNGKRFIATGPAYSSSSSGNIIAWSADGISWKAYSSSKTVTPGLRWVAVGSGSRATIATSPDGKTWYDVSGSALLFPDISGVSTTVSTTLGSGAKTIGWNGNSLIVGGSRGVASRSTIPVYAFIGSGVGIGADAALNMRITPVSSVFVSHMDLSRNWQNTYTDFSGSLLFQVTPEQQYYSSAIKWNGYAWVANFGMTSFDPSGVPYGTIWYTTDPLAKVGWSVASNYAEPRILTGQGGYAGLEWNGTAWLACGYDVNNNNLIYTSDKYGATGWTAVSGGLVSGGNSSFQPVCIAKSNRYWVVGGQNLGLPAIFYTSDRSGATGWTMVDNTTSVLPGARITSIAYNGASWLCCGGNQISWRRDTGTSDIRTGWALTTSSGANLPSIMDTCSALSYNDTNGTWVVVGDASGGTNVVSYTKNIDGSGGWTIPTVSSTFSSSFYKLNGLIWDGKSWIATSGAGFSRIASTNTIDASTNWNNTNNTLFSPSAFTNAITFANIPISLITTGMISNTGTDAGIGALYRSGLGRGQGMFGNETSSVVVRSANGAESLTWSQTFSKNFLIAVGGGAIRDVSGGGGLNRMSYSYDGGVTWTLNNSPVLSSTTNVYGNIRTVKYGNGIWVAGGDISGSTSGHCLAYSRDGVNWTGAGGAQIFGNNGACYAVSYGDNGRWVAVGGSPMFGPGITTGSYTNVTGSNYTMAWSDDGINWNPIIESRGIFGIVCQGVSYGTDGSGVGMWCAIGRGAGRTNQYTGIAYSYDGKKWFLPQTSNSLFDMSSNMLIERYSPTAPIAPITVTEGKVGLAISSTGQYQIIVIANTGIYRSSDYGVTWTIVTGTSATIWMAVAISASGQYQTAVSNGTNSILRSADYGVNWSIPTVGITGNINVSGVAVSATGQYQSACVNSGVIYRSINYGVNWQASASTSGAWGGIAMSATGQYQYAYGPSSYGHRSVDYGINWSNPNSTTFSGTSISCSSSGQYVTIGTTSSIYVSTNYLTVINSFSTAAAVAISSSGQYQTGGGTSNIVRSTDSGANWVTNTNSPSTTWIRIAMSSTGQYQTAVSNTGVIYISSNFGLNWSATGTDSRSLGITYGKDASGNGLWVTTAGRRDISANLINTMAYSYNGKSWTGIPASSGFSHQAWSVAYGKDGYGAGMWVAGGYDTTCGLKWSYDGINWNAALGSGAHTWASFAAGRRVISVHWNGSIWIASTNASANGEYVDSSENNVTISNVVGYLIYSYNGKNWLPMLPSSSFNSGVIVRTYYSLPNPSILAFGSMYDDISQRGYMIENTKKGTVGSVYSNIPPTNVNTIVPFGKASNVTGNMSFLMGGDSGLIDVSAGSMNRTGISPITGELSATSPSLSVSVDGGVRWSAVQNSAKIMTKVNKIMCDESTQQIVAVGAGNYSIATSTPATATTVDGWTGVLGSRMTDTKTGLFDNHGTNASWSKGSKMWIASGNPKTGSGSSLAVSVNGTVWQDAKIVSRVTAGTTSGLINKTTTSNTSTVSVSDPSYSSYLTTTTTTNTIIPYTAPETTLLTYTNSAAAFSTRVGAVAVNSQNNCAIAGGSSVQFVAGGKSGTTLEDNNDISNNNLAYSYDGVKWTPINYASSSSSGSIFKTPATLTTYQNVDVSCGLDASFGTSVLVSRMTPKVVPSTAFYFISVSATGQYQSAVVNDTSNNLYTSTDYGSSWTVRTINVGAAKLTSISISATGQYQSAVSSGSSSGYIYTSADYGVSWTRYTGISALDWGSITISSTGQYQSAVLSGSSSNIYTSSNYGILWTPRIMTTNNYKNISMSATGQYQSVTTSSSGYLYISSNYGVAWNQRSNSPPAAPAILANCNNISVSSNGMYQLVTSTSSTNIHASMDYGYTWSARLGTPIGIWSAISQSSNGRYQTAIIDASGIFVSSNYGVTWVQQMQIAKCISISISSSGKYQSAVVNPTTSTGFIYTSSNYGLTWSMRTTPNITNTFTNIKSSSSGQYQLATSGVSTSTIGQIYVSSTYGTSWSPLLNAGAWFGCAVSTSGNLMMGIQGGTFPDKFYIRTGGTNWRDYIRMSFPPSDISAAWGTIDIQFYDVNTTPANEIAKQFSYFAGYWLNALRAPVGQVYSVPTYTSAGLLSGGTFTFKSTSSPAYPVTTYTGSIGATYTDRTLTPQADAIIAGRARGITRSTDFGETWSDPSGTILPATMASTGFLKGISITNSGVNQTAIAYGGSIYRSSDSGVTFDTAGITIDGASNNTSTVRNWQDVAISAETGAYQVVCVSGGLLYKSSNMGVDFSSSIIIGGASQSNTNRAWQALAISGDGKYALACTTSPSANGYIYRSENYGATWDPSNIRIDGLLNTMTTRQWQDVGMSSNGKYQVALDYQTLNLVDPSFSTTTYGFTTFNKSEGTTWNKISSDITGAITLTTPDLLGSSISISANGTTIIIGCPGYNNNKGNVRVYDLSVNGTWVNTQNIDGLSDTTANIGCSVAISADGNTIAFGAKNDSNNNGQVDIWKRSSGGVFLLISPSIPSTSFNGIQGETSSELFGSSISLSADGTIFAAGGVGYDFNRGRIQLYKYSGSGTSWDKIVDILGETANEYFGSSVSISANGFIAAAGGYNASSGKGVVRLYNINSASFSTSYFLNNVSDLTNLLTSTPVNKMTTTYNSGVTTLTLSPTAPNTHYSMGYFKTNYIDGSLNTILKGTYEANIYGLYRGNAASLYGKLYHIVERDLSSDYIIDTSYTTSLTNSEIRTKSISLPINNVSITLYKIVFPQLKIINGPNPGTVTLQLRIVDNQGSFFTSQGSAFSANITIQPSDITANDRIFEYPTGRILTSSGSSSSTSFQFRIIVNDTNIDNTPTMECKGNGANDADYKLSAVIKNLIYDGSNNRTTLIHDSSQLYTIKTMTIPNAYDISHFKSYSKVQFEPYFIHTDSSVATGSSFMLSFGNGSSSQLITPIKSSAIAFTKIGTDISGETAGENFGSSVSISSDGTTVAAGGRLFSTGASNKGVVRIYRPNTSGVWNKIGTRDISGDIANELFGTSVSLSSNGNIVAVGVPGATTGKGLLRIYKNVSGTWTKMGTDLSGTTDVSFGQCICLSSDGMTVSAGAPATDTNKGLARTYNINNVTLPSDIVTYTSSNSLIAKIFGYLLIIGGTNGKTTITATQSGKVYLGVLTVSGSNYTLVYNKLGCVYYSKDYGLNWAKVNAAGSNYWSSVAISANGCTISATTNDSSGSIFSYTMPDEQYTMPSLIKYDETSSTIITASTQSTSGNWYSVSMSSNGKYQSAVINGGKLYRSTNWGVTWAEPATTATLGNKNWTSINVSSTGQYQTACISDGTTTTSMYTSSDYGITWTARTVPAGGKFNSISLSSTGLYQTAVITSGRIYRSDTSGVTWSEPTTSISIGNQNWSSIAVSSTGAYQTAVVNNGRIWRSIDYGVSWDASLSFTNSLVTDISRSWLSVAMSSSGQYQTAGLTNDAIWISSDYGASWKVATTTKSASWNSIAVSSTGQYQTSYTLSGEIFTSNNYGETFGLITTYASPNYTSVTISSSGRYQTVGANGGLLYFSKDFGQTWSANASYYDIYIPASVNSIAYGNTGTGAITDGYWVAGATSAENSLAYSSNGIDWVPVTGSKTALFDAVNGVAYGTDVSGTNIWIAVGKPFIGSLPYTPGVANTGTAYSIAYSYNMTTWAGVNNTNNFTGQGNRIAFGKDACGNNMWVAVGEGDGNGPTNDINRNRMAGAPNNTICYSYDGVCWCKATGTGIFSTAGNDIAWGLDSNGVGTWVATGVGYTDSSNSLYVSGGKISYSLDGKVWTAVALSSPFSTAGLCIGYGRAGNNGDGLAQWIVGGSGTNVLCYSSKPSSALSNDWSVVASSSNIPFTTGSVCNTITYYNGKWFAGSNVDASYSIATSSDGGLTWPTPQKVARSTTESFLGGCASIGVNAYCNFTLAYADNTTDTNMRSWITIPGTKSNMFETGTHSVATISSNIIAATHTAGKNAWWVAAGEGKTDTAAIAYTLDASGITGWTAVTTGGITDLSAVNDVVFSPQTQTWLAVGRGSTKNVLYSDVSGVKWTSVSLDASNVIIHTCVWNQLDSSASSSGRWLAGGTTAGSGATAASLFISTDVSGSSWTRINGTGAILSTVYSITYNGSAWIAAGIPASGVSDASSCCLMRTFDITGLTNWLPITGTKTYSPSTTIGNGGFDTSARSISWNSDNKMWISTGENTGIVDASFSSIIYSTDISGSVGTWKSVRESNSLFSVQGNSVAFTGKKWIAAGEGTNTICESLDASASSYLWSSTTATGGTRTLTRATDIAFTGSTIVAVGQSSIGANSGLSANYVTNSSGGTTWSANNIQFATDNSGCGVTSIDYEPSYDISGLLVATGKDASGNNSISYSTDYGVSWTAGTALDLSGATTTNTQKLFTNSGNGVAYIGNDTLFSGGGNDIRWNGKRWISTGKNSDAIVTSNVIGSNDIVVTNNNSTPIAISNDGVTWSSISTNQTTVITDGAFIATNSRISAEPLIDSQILVVDGGDTEISSDYGNNGIDSNGNSIVNGMGLGIAQIDIIGENPVIPTAAHSIATSVNAIGLGLNNGAGISANASFDNTAFSISTRNL